MTLSQVELVEVGPDDVLFAGWCDVWAATRLADRPDEPPPLVSEHVAVATLLLADGGSRDGTHRAAIHGGVVVGALRVILPTKDNRTSAYVDIAVHPARRRQGVGNVLLESGLQLARERGRTVGLAEVDEPRAGTAGREFALRNGWSCDLVETRRDLHLPVAEVRLAALEAEARRASRGYEVVTWRDWTPEELLDDRAVLEQRMSTDAPSGDLPLDEERWDAARIREYERLHVSRGRTVLSAGAVRDGRLVAFTDLQVPLTQPELAHQGGTLVLAEHRGHRLGALVKATVLRELGATMPAVRRIETTNAESNAPMVAVNEALGFVPAGHLSSWSVRL